MCRFRSAIVTRDKRVFLHPTSDSHTEIRLYHHLPEDGLIQRHVPVEYVPGAGALEDLSHYSLHVDAQAVPDWWTDEHASIAVAAITADVAKMMEGLTVGGDLDLSGAQITSLPEGLTVKGRIYR